MMIRDEKSGKRLEWPFEYLIFYADDAIHFKKKKKELGEAEQLHTHTKLSANV